MNKILVLGTGLQGKAALYDLAHSPDVSHVIAADSNIEELSSFVAELPGNKITCVQVDACDIQKVGDLMEDVKVAIILLPPDFSKSLAPLAVAKGVHWVDASYTVPEQQTLHTEAAERNLAILPEFGLDPGIDLLLAAKAISEFDEVTEFYSYGAGIPEMSAANNPLNYRISWTWDIVLYSYTRPARLLSRDQIVEIPASEVFAADNVHIVDLEGVGPLEAFPNGDAIRYAEILGMNGLRNTGRYTMRWPGHSAFWDKLVNLGFLENTPVQVGESAISPRDFVGTLLEPQLQYSSSQRDLAIVRVDVRGLKDGRQSRVVYQVIDYRDLESGLMAMQRTVGFTASIGAQMILRGDISKRGLLSPLTDVPPEPILEALSRRGITVDRTEYATTP